MDLCWTLQRFPSVHTAESPAHGCQVSALRCVKDCNTSSVSNHSAGNECVSVIDALCQANLRRQALKGVIILCEGVPCQNKARPLLLLSFLFFINLWHV